MAASATVSNVKKSKLISLSFFPYLLFLGRKLGTSITAKGKRSTLKKGKPKLYHTVAELDFFNSLITEVRLFATPPVTTTPSQTSAASSMRKMSLVTAAGTLAAVITTVFADKGSTTGRIVGQVKKKASVDCN